MTQESYSNWRNDFEKLDEVAPLVVGGAAAALAAPYLLKRFAKPQVDKMLDGATKITPSSNPQNRTQPSLQQTQQDARDIGKMTGTSGLMNTTINTSNRLQSKYDRLRSTMRDAGMKGADQNMNMRGVMMKNSYQPEGEVVEGYDDGDVIRPTDRIKMRDGKLRTIKDIDAKLKEKKPVQKNSFEPKGQMIPEDAFDPNFVDRKRRQQDRSKDKVKQAPADASKNIDTRPPADFPNAMGPATSGGRSTNRMGPGTSGGRSTNSIKAEPLATLNRGEKGDGFLGPTITIGKKRIGIPNISPIRNEEVEAVEEGKKDACYHKVKSRYSVWPSAYASGALVKCRKVGAKNWGNKSKKNESVDYSNWRDDFIPTEYETTDLIKADPIQVPPSNLQKIEEAKKCWKGYKKVGTQKLFGKTYNRCEKIKKEHYDWRAELEEGAAWTKKSGKNPSGGLNEKGRKSYERENPGSDLKRPSKKVGNKRRASFCARMKGMKKKLTSKKTANDPNSRINKSLRAWNC